MLSSKFPLLAILLIVITYGLLWAQVPPARFILPGYMQSPDETGAGFPVVEGGNWVVKSKDLDGDSVVDLIIGRSFQEDVILLNDGTGRFRIAPNQSWSMKGGTYDFVFADLNYDGLDDIVAARGTATGGNDALIRNLGRDQILIAQGNGIFEEKPLNLPSDTSWFLLPAPCPIFPALCNTFLNVDTMNNSMGVAIGFLDDDTIPDLVFANGGVQYLKDIRLEGSNFNLAEKVQLLTNDIWLGKPDSDGDGVINFQVHPPDSSGLSTPDLSTDVAVADFNGDGHDDFFITNFYSFALNIFLNLPDSCFFNKLYLNDSLGKGHFTWKKNAFPLEKMPSTSVNAADIDRDGDIDLLITNETKSDSLFLVRFQTTTKIYYNENGVFRDTTQYLFPPGFKQRTLYHNSFDGNIAYINNDTLPDLFVAGSHCFLMIQNPDGTFSDSTENLPTNPSSGETFTFHSYGSTVADLNNDGKKDIVLVDTYEQNRLHLQGVDFQFIDTTTVNLPPDGENTQDVIVADLNGDGKKEIVTVTLESINTHAFYLEDPSGPLNYPFFRDRAELIPINIKENFGIAMADINHDAAGLADLLISGRQGIQLIHNSGGNPPVFQDSSAAWLQGISINSAVNKAEFYDINNDGWQDIFLPMGNNNPVAVQNRLLLWNSTLNRFVDSTLWLPSYTGASVAVDFAHLNNDNWVDMVVAENDQPITLYISDTASLNNPGYTAFAPFANHKTMDVAFADFNLDGAMDLVEVVDDNPTPRYVHMNLNAPDPQGMPTFASQAVGIPTKFDKAVTILDMNQDGFPDFVSCGLKDVGIFLYDSAATSFIEATQQYIRVDTFPGSGAFANALAFEDVNGDGLLDLYLARDNQDWLLYGCNDTIDNCALMVAYESPEENEHLIFRAYPNPYTGYTQLEYELDEKANTHLSVFNLQGQLISHLYEGWQLKGRHTFRFSARELGFPAGLYIAVLTVAGKRVGRKIVEY